MRVYVCVCIFLLLYFTRHIHQVFFSTITLTYVLYKLPQKVSHHISLSLSLALVPFHTFALSLSLSLFLGLFSQNFSYKTKWHLFGIGRKNTFFNFFPSFFPFFLSLLSSSFSFCNALPRRFTLLSHFIPHMCLLMYACTCFVPFRFLTLSLSRTHARTLSLSLFKSDFPPYAHTLRLILQIFFNV